MGTRMGKGLLTSYTALGGRSFSATDVAADVIRGDTGDRVVICLAKS